MPTVQTYLNTGDHLTVWQLAHDWAGKDSTASDPNNLPPEIKAGIYRVLVAIRNQLISVRDYEGLVIVGGSFWAMLFDVPHLLKFNACLTKSRFDKGYLDSLYVWRPEVIRWCITVKHWRYYIGKHSVRVFTFAGQPIANANTRAFRNDTPTLLLTIWRRRLGWIRCWRLRFGYSCQGLRKSMSL
jgi:hypothetical protein